MNTKELIMDVSLKLFAKNGYDGTSVRQIAKEVGVRESALYRHFKNKEDILNSVIKESQKRIKDAYIENEVPETVMEDISKGYRELSQDKLFEISWNLFSLYTKDPIVSNFRKLLLHEKSRNVQSAKLYDQFFLSGVIKHQSLTFNALVEGEFFSSHSPDLIALHFYSPILFLFERYDCNPECEPELKELLKLHITTFGGFYGKN